MSSLLPDSSKANNDRVSWKAENSLSGIPMPPEIAENHCNAQIEQSTAWIKAQEALKKVSVSAAASNTTSSFNEVRTPSNVQAQFMFYYPWLAQHSYIAPPYAPVPPSFGPSNPAFMNPVDSYSANMVPTEQVPPPPPPPAYPCRPIYPSYPTWTLQESSSSSRTQQQQRLQQPHQQQSYAANNSQRFRSQIKFAIKSKNLSQASSIRRDTEPDLTSNLSDIPKNVRNYMERSYMAVEKKEDRDKLEDYFKEKLNPLLTSGAYTAVDWDKEPLPSDVNFEVKKGWTPVSELKKNATKSPAQTAGMKGKQDSAKRKSSQVAFQENRRRVPFSPRVRLPSPDDDDVEEQVSPKVKLQNRKKKQRKSGEKTTWVVDEQSNSRREERVRRFGHPEDSRKTKFLDTHRNVDWYLDTTGEGTSDTVIVGTCTDIEKSYFRLTSAPDPSSVRPLSILEKALKVVQHKYLRNKDYTYANDQLRSIRQDLMIQNIRTEFTVTVYETNARIAIEQADREEFNQCQSQLRLLYKEFPTSLNRYEFDSYRLLYYIAISNTIDQNTLLSELNDSAQEDECMSFALSVRRAWALGNYVRLFRLYKNAPRMASYVMDLFLDRERKAALNACLKSFRPSISVNNLASKLGLSKEKLDEFLATFGISAKDGKIDCRIHSNAITS